MRLFPLMNFDQIELDEANRLLSLWGHRIGPILRPMNGSLLSGGGDAAHALFLRDEPIAVTVTSTLIRENVAGHPELTRDNTCELSRLCAARPDACRLILRLWRIAVFEPIQDRFPFAVSYQDANLHTGNTYRFDGWEQIGKSRSGTDSRSGRKGRSKIIWRWPNLKSAVAARSEVR